MPTSFPPCLWNHLATCFLEVDSVGLSSPWTWAADVWFILSTNSCCIASAPVALSAYFYDPLTYPSFSSSIVSRYCARAKVEGRFSPPDISSVSHHQAALGIYSWRAVVKHGSRHAHMMALSKPYYKILRLLVPYYALECSLGKQVTQQRSEISFFKHLDARFVLTSYIVYLPAIVVSYLDLVLLHNSCS